MKEYMRIHGLAPVWLIVFLLVFSTACDDGSPMGPEPEAEVIVESVDDNEIDVDATETDSLEKGLTAPDNARIEWVAPGVSFTTKYPRNQKVHIRLSDVKNKSTGIAFYCKPGQACPNPDDINWRTGDLWGELQEEGFGDVHILGVWSNPCAWSFQFGDVPDSYLGPGPGDLMPFDGPPSEIGPNYIYLPDSGKHRFVVWVRNYRKYGFGGWGGCTRNTTRSDRVVTIDPNYVAPLSISINGPYSINLYDSVKYTASASGAYGNYSYQWSRRYPGQTTFSSASTGSSTYVNFNTTSIQYIDLKLKVTSGSKVNTTTRRVYNNGYQSDGSYPIRIDEPIMY